MAMTYKKLTDDEILRASETNLVDFLSFRGEKVERRGSSHFYTGQGNDTLAIWGSNNHLYTHHSIKETGNAIKFCREYLGMSFQESVEALLGNSFYIEVSYQSKIPKKDDKPIEKAEFQAPVRDDNQKRLYAYLQKERKISKRVIDYFTCAGTLYQTKEFSESKQSFYSNIAFAVNDFNGKEVGTMKRATFKDGFRGNHKGSQMQNYCFRHTGSSDRVFIYEAPIDMLSYISFMENSNKDWKNDSFLALGGLHSSAFFNFLNHKADINNVYLCLDNDMKGIEGSLDIVKKLDSIGFSGKVFCHFPQNKDWNEDLKNGVVSDNLCKGGVEILTDMLKNLYSVDEVAR